MTAEPDEKPEPEGTDPKAQDKRIDDALRDIVAPDEDTSCGDADASAFLERFPAAAREPQRPKED